MLSPSQAAFEAVAAACLEALEAMASAVRGEGEREGMTVGVIVSPAPVGAGYVGVLITAVGTPVTKEEATRSSGLGADFPERIKKRRIKAIKIILKIISPRQSLSWGSQP